jgi:RNA polymerase sigma factor (sigma-70 family)
MNDWQLLQDYTERHSEEAFRVLVQNHVNMVHAVAMRQVQDPHLAEEVAQTVFVLLARKAGSFRPNLILPGWLFRTTRFVAAHAVRSERRRQRREQEAFRMQSAPSKYDAWMHLAPVVDMAMEQLGETDRHAILLKYYQDKPLRDVGAAMGTTEDAAKKRVSRALGKLRVLLAKRGVVVPVSVLSAALLEHAAEAAPGALAAQIASQTRAQAADAAPGLPALVQEILQAWRWAKAKQALAFGAGVLSLAIMIGLVCPLSRHSVSTDKAILVSPKSTRSNNGKLSKASKTTTTTVNTARMIFHVEDAKSGAGIPEAQIFVRLHHEGTGLSQSSLSADTRGQCEINLGSTSPSNLSVGVLAPGYAQRSLTWQTKLFGPIPSEYTLKLTRGVNIGGRVFNESGQPVSGAEIALRFFGSDGGSWIEPTIEGLGLSGGAITARTDTNGYWATQTAPPRIGDFSILARHSDYLPAALSTDFNGPNRFSKIKALSIKELWEGTAIITLVRGMSLAGKVTDEADNPLSGAEIYLDSISNETETTTVADGSFILKPLSAGMNAIVFSAEGYAPTGMQFLINTNTPPVHVRLQPGRILRLHVIDERGESLPEVSIAVEGWRGEYSLRWDGLTDSDGLLEWRSAPHDAGMTFCAIKTGYRRLNGFTLKTSDEEQEIIMAKAPLITGHVVDAATGAPIARFKVIFGESAASPNWCRSDPTYGTNGLYQASIGDDHYSKALLVEAEDYEAQWKEITGSTCDFALRKGDARDGIRGVVRLPDGTAVADAEVALCTFDKGARLNQARFVNRYESILTQTFADGQFAFKPQPDALSIVAVHELGFARMRLAKIDQPVEITLQPWGRIEGCMRTADGLWTRRTVVLYDDAWSRYPGGMALDDSFRTETDGQGKFAFDFVPPGMLRLYYKGIRGISGGSFLPIEVQPGRISQVQIGGAGQPVAGQLTWPDPARKMDWVGQSSWPCIQTISANDPHPKELAGQDLLRWQADFWMSDKGLAFLRKNPIRIFMIEVADDGSFLIDDVVPGAYRLYADISKNSIFHSDVSDMRTTLPQGHARRDFIVPEVADPNLPLNLGGIDVSVNK